MTLLELESAYVNARYVAYRNAHGLELRRRLDRLDEWYEYHYANILADTLIKKWTRCASVQAPGETAQQ